MKGKVRSSKNSSPARKFIRIDDEIEIISNSLSSVSGSSSGSVTLAKKNLEKKKFSGLESKTCFSDKIQLQDAASKVKGSSLSPIPKTEFNSKLLKRNDASPPVGRKTPVEMFYSVPHAITSECENSVKNDLITGKHLQKNCSKSLPSTPKNKCVLQTPVLYQENKVESPSNAKSSVSNLTRFQGASRVSKVNSAQKNLLLKKDVISDPLLNSPCEKVYINEADTPPFTPTHEIYGSDSRSSSIAAGANLSGGLKSPMQDASEECKSGMIIKEDISKQVKNTLPKSKMKIPVSPSDNNKKLIKKRREVDILYEALQETSWAQDKTFTTLLLDKNCTRYSGRISTIKSSVADRAKRMDKGKTTDERKVQNRKITKLTVKPKQKSSVSAILSQKLKAKAQLALNKKQPLSQHRAKGSADCQIVKVVKSAKDTLPSSSVKAKKTLDVKIKSENAKQAISEKSKLSMPAVKVNKKVPSISNQKKKLSMKSSLKNVRLPGSALINDSSPSMLSNEILVNDNSPDDVRLIEKLPAKSSSNPKNRKRKLLGNNTKNRNLIRETQEKSERIDSVFQEFGILQSFFQQESANTVVSTVHRGPELRVTLEPLENTDLWASDCYLQNTLQKEYEAFRKKTIHQTMLKVLASIDQSYASSVLREVQDSINGTFSGTKSSKKRKYDEESVRTSVRQSECAFRYKEIVVKKHQNYIQVVLVPNSNKQNCLSVEAMKELKEAFLSARKDPNCRAVLLNSSGTFFCSGIDLSQLFGSNKKHIAEEMAVTVRDLVLTLAIFPKPVVAAVNGNTIGLGVSLLTFCDIVLASDKATFCIPSARLGYLPEGGVTLTLPQVVGSTVAIEMLLQGRRLTAQQALRHGLVSEVIWPTQLMEQVVPRMQMLVAQQLPVMEATKTMVRCHLWEKLAVQLEREWRMLPSQWLSSNCQQNIKRLMQTGWLFD